MTELMMSTVRVRVSRVAEQVFEVRDGESELLAWVAGLAGTIIVLGVLVAIFRLRRPKDRR